jgi:tetratricopeptide (TPR) repeat protein
VDFLDKALKKSRGKAFTPKNPASLAGSMTLTLTLIAFAIFVYREYSTRSMLNWAEKNALMNGFLICSIILFSIFLFIFFSSRYFYMISYGERKYLAWPHGAFDAISFIILIFTMTFIGSELTLKPTMFQDGLEVDLAALLLALSAIANLQATLRLKYFLKPDSEIREMILQIVNSHISLHEKEPVESLSMAAPVIDGKIERDLLSLIIKLYKKGNIQPVEYCMETLKAYSLKKIPGYESTINDTLACNISSLIIEIGMNSARDEDIFVTGMAMDTLTEIAVSSESSLASEISKMGILQIYSSCDTTGGLFKLRASQRFFRSYLSIFDKFGEHETLESAMKALEDATSLEKAINSARERIGLLYMSGCIYRRAGEMDINEEKINMAINDLSDALKVKDTILSPIDMAYIKAELGRSYMALAKAKNPIKSYKLAINMFSEANKILDEKSFKYDHSMLQSQTGYAYSMLADEYFKIRKNDEAIICARSAIAAYSVPAKFFAMKRAPMEYGMIMSNLGLAHAIISDIYGKSRMFRDALKHAYIAISSFNSAIEAYSSFGRGIDLARLKTSIGISYITIAEICFREKRYDEAINTCDSAIAAYNEAIKMYEGSGKDKLALTARKNLKDANELFNTMMRIGASKPVPYIE